MKILFFLPYIQGNDNMINNTINKWIDLNKDHKIDNEDEYSYKKINNLYYLFFIQLLHIIYYIDHN